MALEIYAVGTFEERGGNNVRTAKDASSYSRPSIFGKDLKGCGSKTHWVFQATAQFNSLSNCEIINEGFLSISGGLNKNNASFPTGVEQMTNFVRDRIMATTAPVI